MIFHVRFYVLLLVSCITSMSIDLNAQNLNVSLGTGFGYVNKNIEFPPNNIFSTINRKIEYIRAIQFGAGINIDEYFEMGGEFSYSWAILNWLPQYRPGNTTINNISWFSFGIYGKYFLFPQKRLQLGIMTSAGINMGYPRYMNADTIEKQTIFYAGLHAGARYRIWERLNLSYYYGRGKYNNMIIIAYIF